MTVAELIVTLQAMPQDALVLKPHGDYEGMREIRRVTQCQAAKNPYPTEYSGAYDDMPHEPCQIYEGGIVNDFYDEERKQYELCLKTQFVAVCIA